MTTSMFDGIFARAKAALAGNPRPAPAFVPAPVVVPMSAPPSTPISPAPKRADVLDVPLAYRFQMQTVTVALHHVSEVPGRFLASLVSGR